MPLLRDSSAPSTRRQRRRALGVGVVLKVLQKYSPGGPDLVGWTIYSEIDVSI